MKRHILYILLSLVATFSFGQDPMSSQPFINKVVYNPAYTGNQLGTTGLVSHRTQWTAIASKLVTTNAQFYTGIASMNAGVGGMITQNTEGSGNLKTISADLMASKVIRIHDERESKMFLYFGLGISLNQKSIDWDKLLFADQLHTIDGIQDVQTSAQTPSSEKNSYLDYMTGVAMKGTHNGIYYNLGFSVDHILEPTESIYQTSEGGLPRKFVSDLFFGIPLNKSRWNNIFMVSGFVNQKQHKFSTSMLGVDLKSDVVFFGAWYKSFVLNADIAKRDALIFHLGVRGDVKKDYHVQLSYSYDATINYLAQNTAGTHELVLRVTFYSKDKYNASKYNNCASFERSNEKEIPFIW